MPYSSAVRRSRLHLLAAGLASNDVANVLNINALEPGRVFPVGYQGEDDPIVQFQEAFTFNVFLKNKNGTVVQEILSLEPAFPRNKCDTSFVILHGESPSLSAVLRLRSPVLPC